MNNTARLAWGIVGTGRISGVFAQTLAESKTGQLVAVASRSQDSADRFASEHGGAEGIAAFDDYEALFNHPAVEAVYIGTPHPSHAELAIRAARAGKHILCEKPAGLNFAEVSAIAEAARANGVFFMEAFMYRSHPQTAKILEIVRSGVLGKIESVRASFGFAASFNPTQRLFSQALGGGAILDVGCYTVSMARLIAGACEGAPFAEPTALKALGRLHPETGVDEEATAEVTFANGMTAQLATSIVASLDNSVTITGSNGTLHIPSPWLPEETSKLELSTNGENTVIEIRAGGSLYSFEADEVAACVRAGAVESAAMPIKDSIGNAATLDRWRNEIGLIYDAEKDTAIRPALPSLRRKAASAVPNLHRAIPGLDKPVSRLAMGTVGAAVIEAPSAFTLYDHFTELGGNCFDTGYIYADGRCERILGEWMKQRGNRKDIVLLTKGAHTPYCTPEHLVAQFHESLERMQTDHTDIYLLHRDNLDVPVGEFVEALNTLKQAGKVSIFGGSNWSLERMDAANAYARENGLQGFSAMSNQFSLARMVAPVWAGCVSCSDADSKEWLEERQMPVFAWSSQSRGFFVRADENFTSDEELVRCWYSKDNFERLCRARELAKAKGSLPIHIAAAYVLQQKFPLFALIGPQNVSELSSSFESLKLTLSPEEMAWLNLESDRQP